MTDIFNRPTILMVDDCALNIKALNMALKTDYHVLFASSGRSALDVATRTKPDLILLDVMMPDMDGFEVCRILKTDPLLRDIPVIFLTSMVDETDEVAGLELGAVDYITKPIKPALVKLRVRNHLEMKRQRDELNSLSTIDGLTGLANRRAFDERLTLEWHRALRSRVPLSLVMIDIDYFKLYNDTYGHLAGDDCLREVARALDKTLNRASDFIARYGGEEFVCILPEIAGKGLRLITEKLCSIVANLKIPHSASLVTPWVTVSLGAATQKPAGTASLQSLVAAADQQLYQAKSLGRNRVCILGK